VQKSSADTGDEDRRQYAVEFLHKSLQEYLVAEKIWESIKAFGDKNSRTGKYAVDTADQALALAWGLFARKPRLGGYIYQYLREHIENDQATDKAAIFDRMLSFAPELLEKQFLHEIMPTEPLKAALHTFADYWAVLAALQPGRNTVPAGVEHRDRFVDLLKICSVSGERPWNLSGVDLSWVDLSGVDLSGVDLSSADLSGANLSLVDLSGSYLSGVDLSYADLSGANLSLVDLSGSYLSGVILRNADMSESILRNTDLGNSVLNGVILSNADMSESILRNTDLSNSVLNGVILSNADMSESILRNVDLSYSDLTGAILRNVDLSKSFLADADLSDADLNGAILKNTDLGTAILINVDLSYADLTGADLSYANLSEVDSLTLEQLQTVETLYQAQGIPPALVQQLKDNGYQGLFEDPTEDDLENAIF
jgi:uncharacterized protein YjbI with pentapeptide repeats